MRQIDAIKTILPNGLRVISVTVDSEIFSMGIGIKVGSLYEDKLNNGISHLVEHMLFKGTAKRTIEDLNNDIEKLAGDMDIYTTYNETVLTINIMKDCARECLDVVSDMLMNASFPEKELRLEKKVIIEEIKMAKDDPEDLSYTGLYKAAFPEEWYKYQIAGTKASVKGINCSMLREFYQTFYVPNNTVICIVSSYSHNEIIHMIEDSFRLWESREVDGLDLRRYTILPKKVISHKKGIGQTHILYGFDIGHLNRREEVALVLLNRKIGSGANSILFKELRDKKGYAYSVYSDIDYTESIKMLYIYTGISEENLKGTLNLIEDVILRFRNGEYIADEGIGLIKNMFLTDCTIAIESATHIVDYLLDGELSYSNPLEYQNVLSIINSINYLDIKNVIEKVLKDPIIHVLSPK